MSLGKTQQSLTTLAPDWGRVAPGRRGWDVGKVIQREGRWKSDAYKVYTRSNIKDCELGLVYYLGRAVILRENRDKERCGTMNKQPLGLA